MIIRSRCLKWLLLCKFTRLKHLQNQLKLGNRRSGIVIISWNSKEFSYTSVIKGWFRIIHFHKSWIYTVNSLFSCLHCSLLSLNFIFSWTNKSNKKYAGMYTKAITFVLYGIRRCRSHVSFKDVDIRHKKVNVISSILCSFQLVIPFVFMQNYFIFNFEFIITW